MTMGWLEAIQFLGLDLQVATVLVAGIVDVALRAIRSARGVPLRTA
jgi:hypothetical protein